MKNIIAFAGSSSNNSINKALVTWAGSQLNNSVVDVLDLNDFEMPIYSIDRENEDGIHEKAKAFKAKLEACDGVMISFAEHNGSYSVAFKNVFDWMSRLGKPIWSDKPMMLMATSFGKRGGAGVLNTATNSFPHQGGQVVASIPLPSFGENFDLQKGITNPELLNDFLKAIKTFNDTVNQ